MSISEDPIKTGHRFSDCIYWNLFILIPLITACVGIARQSVFWLIVYLLLSVVVFFVVVLKFFCTHCPHYIQGAKTTKCMFFWGVPKFFKAKSEPLKLFDKTVAVVVSLVITLLPLYWLSLQPGLLVIYFLSVIVLFTTLRRYECRRCIYSQCPSNCAKR